MHSFNPCTSEAEAARLLVWVQPGLHSEALCTKICMNLLPQMYRKVKYLHDRQTSVENK